ncbi:MAG: hypothetical protein AAF597_14735, partial [Bacteroidota bacterium]
MRKHPEAPAGQRFGTVETDRQLALIVARQLREPEGGFLEVGADLDGGFFYWTIINSGLAGRRWRWWWD